MTTLRPSDGAGPDKNWTLTDAAGHEAAFTADGFLCGGVTGGVAWQPAVSTPGWSIAANLDGQVSVGIPAGNGVVTPNGGDRIEIVFSGVRFGSTVIPARVTLTWRLRDGWLEGRIALIDWPADRDLHAVVFPDLAVAYNDASATQLVVPSDTGWVIEEAATVLAGGDANAMCLDHPPMQFLAWIEAGRGLYLDTRDTEGWLREWRLKADAERCVHLGCWHLAPRVEGGTTGFSPPYPITLGGFEGGWYEAARIYRPWALRTPWAQRGPSQRRSTFVADVACWVWNRGRAAEVAPAVKELARRIGAPVALDWYWWHQHGYDTEYPDYFPPREGEAVFRSAVSDLQAHDVRVQVYTNGMCYDVDGRRWEPDGPECAIMKADGSWIAPAYNPFMNHRLASVCGAADRWRPILLNLVRQAQQLGLDGLYLDMIAAVGGRMPCFHPRHGHAPGGGCYGVQGFRSMLHEARTMAPGFPLSSESCQEWYLDLFDSHIICGVSLERLKWQAERFNGRTRVVPLFSAVYHGHTVGFGNYSFLDGIPPFDELWPAQYRTPPDREKDWVALCPDQFALELTRTVIFGLQPLVANLRIEHFDDPRLQADIAFLIELARLYYREREFLLWGDMLPPGRLRCPLSETVFLQRFVFTAPGEETYLRRELPSVMHSAWQAPDGRRVAILINYTRQPAPLSYVPGTGPRIDADATKASLPEGARMQKTDDGFAIDLPPRSVARLTLLPDGA